MPKQGEVRVRLCRRWCVAVARLMDRLPERGIKYPLLALSADRLALAASLSALMHKAAKRKRNGTGFVVNIDRELVAFFATFYMPIGMDQRAIRRAQSAFAFAVKAKRGPRRLSIKSMEDRANGRVRRNLEHTIRLRRRLRHDKAREAWFEEVTARGETIMTTSLPFPEI